jgi:hypothetical protein
MRPFRAGVDALGADVPDSYRMFWRDVGETLVPSQRSAVELNAGMVAGNR